MSPSKIDMAFILNPEPHSTPLEQPSRISITSLLTTISEPFQEDSLRARHTPRQGSIQIVYPKINTMHKLLQFSEQVSLDKARPRRILICKNPTCNSAVVSKGLCVRHGGGSRCSVNGCFKGAKLYGKCFRHGGFKFCKVETCTSKAKRYGFCWGHGGGDQCLTEGCSKVATLGGNCWAHGGGNRCRVDGCERRSYKQHEYICKSHYRLHQLSAVEKR